MRVSRRLSEAAPLPKLSPMENGDLSTKVAFGKERSQGLAVSHRSVPALGASNGNFDGAVVPCLADDDACDGLQIRVVGEAAQGILMDTSVRCQVGVMLRIPKSLQRDCSQRSIASEVRTGTRGFNMDNFGRRRDRGGHGYGGRLGRSTRKLSMAVVVVVLVDEAAGSFQH